MNMKYRWWNFAFQLFALLLILTVGMLLGVWFAAVLLAFFKYLIGLAVLLLVILTLLKILYAIWRRCNGY